MVVNGGHWRSPVVNRIGCLTWGTPGIPGFSRWCRVPSHGRGHWFEPSIAHHVSPGQVGDLAVRLVMRRWRGPLSDHARVNETAALGAPSGLAGDDDTGRR